MSLNFSFDYFNQFELPPIWLTNPDGTQLYMLGSISDRQLKLRFNALSEFSFVAQKFIDGIENDYYDYLDYRRIVSIENIANFMIETIEETNDGIIQEKKITCKSLEVELAFKKLSLFKGPFIFYDSFNVASTLMGQLLSYIPGWTISHVDATLYGIQRSFDVTDTNIYEFMMNQISQTYQCIFTFDTINKTIRVDTTDSATTNTDIFLSYQNLVDQVSIKEITEELVTALNVFGGGDLRINQVNPLGNDTIYDFSYYKNTNWMSSGLITSLTNWENLISASQIIYANNLTTLTTLSASALGLQTQLATLQSELSALEEVLTVRIRQNITTPPDNIAAQNALVIAKRVKITAKNLEIETKNNQINAINSILQSLNTAMSFTTNFTNAEILELNNFIIGSTYTNENFIKTDISTSVEIQQYSQELYDQAQQVLAKVSEPRYMFDVNSTNFVFLKEFQIFINQLVLGAVVTVEFDDGHFAYPALLGMDFSYDNPNDFKMIFSNRLRLDDAAFQFSDLFSQSVSTGISTTFNSEIWSSWQNYSKDSVTTFITSALDAAKNAVTSAKNQNFILDANGFRGRLLTNADTNEFDPKQFWMINNMLAFTEDNWNNAALALGEVTLPAGGTAYGLIADVVVGHLVASNNLLVENEDKSFSMDGNGARLHNASLIIDNNNSQILLDATKGIEITRRDPANNNEFTDKRFYVDPVTGDVVFAGNLTGASGTFSGTINATSGHIGQWIIDNDGLKDLSGNYIYGNGRVALANGKFTIEGDVARFHGTFYANNLNEGDKFTGLQLRDVDASTITTGALYAIDIYGTHIYWPSVRMFSPDTGISLIEADNNITIRSINSSISISPAAISISSVGSVDIGNPVDGIVKLEGRIDAIDSNYNRGTGITGTFVL